MSRRRRETATPPWSRSVAQARRCGADYRARVLCAPGRPAGDLTAGYGLDIEIYSYAERWRLMMDPTPIGLVEAHLDIEWDQRGIDHFRSAPEPRRSAGPIDLSRPGLRDEHRTRGHIRVRCRHLDERITAHRARRIPGLGRRAGFDATGLWDCEYPARMRSFGASRRLIPERCSVARVLTRRSPMSGDSMSIMVMNVLPGDLHQSPSISPVSV